MPIHARSGEPYGTVARATSASSSIILSIRTKGGKVQRARRHGGAASALAAKRIKIIVSERWGVQKDSEGDQISEAEGGQESRWPSRFRCVPCPVPRVFVPRVAMRIRPTSNLEQNLRAQLRA
ncbi:hypothetical protein FIBSPDRAFT_969447 [Athelia psychrophila]|uniref:Uncharacterized protein n=1 Tax=Athelia psychrophila TaxID=1759441 RepID=A0A167THN1_9AGAM|nr:hypothetical protein FIBSPDRAFT_969447 [Fibularhizoctonia sp. CBS 109695]